MKQIIKYVLTYELNGMTTQETINCWDYTEMPLEKKQTHTFDELPNCHGFVANYTMIKNRYVSAHLRWGAEPVRRDSFKSASTTITPIAVDMDNVSITTLAEKLSAIDFVAWCHDNGVTAISFAH